MILNVVMKPMKFKILMWEFGGILNVIKAIKYLKLKKIAMQSKKEYNHNEIKYLKIFILQK